MLTVSNSTPTKDYGWFSHVAINKSRLKEYFNQHDYNSKMCYLKDGAEFQIELFNSYQYPIFEALSLVDL